MRPGNTRPLLAKKHLKVKRQRRDFHFKEARKIVAQYQSIKVEDLNIKVMVKNHNAVAFGGGRMSNQTLH